MTAALDLCSDDLREQPRNRYQIDCADARLHVHARSVATVLRVDGEIDASNAHLVAHEIARFSRLKTPLILDLGQLDFLGSAGFSVLQILVDDHRLAGLHCSVVGGPALHRLTAVVRNHGLPVVDSVTEALRQAEVSIRARRRFVPGPARQEEPQRTAAVRC
jgi:anti-anti-sigma factor